MDKFEAIHYQEWSAAHARWALEQLLSGDLESAVDNQEEAATSISNGRCWTKNLISF